VEGEVVVLVRLLVAVVAAVVELPSLLHGISLGPGLSGPMAVQVVRVPLRSTPVVAVVEVAGLW
jgi:hypothetical protein